MITSKDEYMQRLHDIQNKENLKELVTLPIDEPRFVIDANTRNIFIPDEFTFLGVKNDHKAETIYFEIDRYFDKADLSEKTCIVQFESIDTTDGSEQVISSGFYPVVKMDIDTADGKIIFGWEIQNDVTFLAGDVRFSVRFYSTEEIGDSIRFSYNFNTTPVSLPVKDTLNTIDKSVSIKPGEVETLTEKFRKLVNDTVQSVESAKQFALSSTASATESTHQAELAAQAAEDASAAATRAENAKQAAETAKGDALDAIDTSKQGALDAAQQAQTGADQATKSAQAAAESAAEAGEKAEAAQRDANAAEGSAKAAADTLAEVEHRLALGELKGDKGDKGDTGADGHTPEYGTDYGTPEQISEIAQSAAEILQPEVNQLKEDLDSLLADVNALHPLTITAFSVFPSLAEKGSTVSAQSFSYSVNRAGAAVTLEGAEVSGGTASRADVLTEDRLYTLRAVLGVAVQNKTAKISFVAPVYYGVGVEFEISAMTCKLQTSRSMSFTVSAGAGRYILLALPVTLGVPTFKVGGFEGGFELVDMRELTNASGHTESYRLYRSTNAGLGSTTVSVT